MPDDLVVKICYCEMLRLQNSGFTTWTSNVSELARFYNLDMSLKTMDFKTTCKKAVSESFKKQWFNNLNNIVQNPSLRTYNKIKVTFGQEPYLYLIKEHKHRISLSRLRASSHTLEIERGRHDRPKKPIEARLCSKCSVLEDELHFICGCSINKELRTYMYGKINGIYSDFKNLNDVDKFIFLMSNTDGRILNWLGKFAFQSFQVRDHMSGKAFC